jgi:CheY-like chemotaxis protein
MGNAVKFTEKGSITVKVYFETLENKNIKLFIEVIDTGIGIDKKEQDKIFQKFEQQNGQSTRKYGGTGLGLAISKKLINIMGGDILLESERDRGSCFTIVLNSIEVDTVQHNTEVQSDIKLSVNDFKEAKVLVVDDLEVNREIISELFVNSKIEILQAESGKEAIELSKSAKPDFILMDIRMPDINGFEASYTIKSAKETESIPIIALTASVQYNRHEVAKAKLDGLLRKPLKQDELLYEMSRFLEYETSQESEVELDTSDVNLEKVLNSLKVELYESYEKTIHSGFFEDAEEFANSLLSLGKEENFKLLVEYADEIIESVNSFDIEMLNRKLNSYDELIEKIENRLKDRDE